MKAIRLFLLTGISLLALSGCQKQLEQTGGQEVRFSASSANTKSAYESSESGQINWTEDDQVFIWSDYATLRYDSSKNYFTYVVTNINGKSADLANPEGTNGLVYSSEKDLHSFWAISPAPTVSENPANAVAKYSIDAAQSMPADATVENGVIPADMSQAFMLAQALNIQKEKYGSTNKTIKFQFQPAFTAFEIAVKGAAAMTDTEEIVLKSVALVSSAGLAGDVEATFATDGLIEFDTTPAEEVLTYTFPDDTKLTKGSTVTFTVFALPADAEGLQLQFTLGDGQVRTATLTTKETADTPAAPITFGACKKHRLYGLAMPNGFKMFASEAELIVADTVPVDDGEFHM